MHSLAPSLLAANVVLAVTAVRAGMAPLILVRDEQPDATIVLAEKPTRAAQLAAFELQHHVRLITGAELPITHELTDARGVRVLVAESSATRALGLKSADFGPQEYLIRCTRNRYSAI